MFKQFKIICIIQARMGSTRLPGKILMELRPNLTVLELVYKRVSLSKFIDKIVVATGDSNENDTVRKLCREKNINCVSGSESDVLERFNKVIENESQEYVVRITADCPFADAAMIDLCISKITENTFYISNTIEETFPDGFDVEIFPTFLLKEAHLNASLASEREHVTPYIRKKALSEKKALSISSSIENVGHLRLTIDHREDFALCENLVNNFSCESLNYAEIVQILLNKPWLQINKHYSRNEGYTKSLKEEKN